jgi:hypothetical protein
LKTSKQWLCQKLRASFSAMRKKEKVSDTKIKI